MVKALRPAARISMLRSILSPERLTTVVDIGANPFAGKPPYAMLRRSGNCRIIGFEPQAEALAELNAQKLENEIFLPYAVGTGEDATLYVTRNSGLVSTLQPEPWVGDYLNKWWVRAAEVVEELTIPTKRLDDIAEVDHIDFLKMDIQGGELNVFQHGKAKLAKTAVIQTEVAILSYYQGQPTFGDIQSELGSQGFIAHKFASSNDHVLGYPLRLADGALLPRSQVTVVDMIYLRNPIHMADLETETIKHMAIIADGVLRSFDLVLRCLWELISRGLVDRTAVDAYVADLKLTFNPAEPTLAEA